MQVYAPSGVFVPSPNFIKGTEWLKANKVNSDIGIRNSYLMMCSKQKKYSFSVDHGGMYKLILTTENDVIVKKVVELTTEGSDSDDSFEWKTNVVEWDKLPNELKHCFDVVCKDYETAYMLFRKEGDSVPYFRVERFNT